MHTFQQYTALQFYELQDIKGPVILLGVPGDDSISLGFSPTEEEAGFRAVIFPSKEAAELCKSTILHECPGHPVRMMQPWVMTHSKFHKSGYTVKPMIGTCPFCGAAVTTGIADRDLFYCGACDRTFPIHPSAE